MVVKMTTMQNSRSEGYPKRPSKKAPQLWLVKNRARARWRANGRRVARPTWLGPRFLSATQGVRLSPKEYNNKRSRSRRSAFRVDETTDFRKSERFVETKWQLRGSRAPTIIIIRKYKFNNNNKTKKKIYIYIYIYTYIYIYIYNSVYIYIYIHI